MKPKNILAFRLSAIGDVAMTVPVIVSVLNQNPECRITMVAPAFIHSFFPKHERLNLIDFDKKKKYKGLKGIYSFFKEMKTMEFDAFADLHSVLRSIILRNLMRLKGIKVSYLKKGRVEKKALTKRNNKKLVPLKHMTERYADVFRNLGLQVVLDHTLHNILFEEVKKRGGKRIGIAPFAKHSEKMYPLERMLKLAEELALKDYEVFIFGSKQEAKLLNGVSSEKINVVAGKFTFAEELKLINTLDLMISMDSSNMHIASLVGVPVVSIWGATHPYAGFLGYGQSIDNVVQRNDLPCRPCSVFGNKQCYRGDLACLNGIEIERILSKI